MGMYAFRRMREQNEAAQKAASVSTSKPKLKKKSVHQMMKQEAKKGGGVQEREILKKILEQLHAELGTKSPLLNKCIRAVPKL